MIPFQYTYKWSEYYIPFFLSVSRSCVAISQLWVGICISLSNTFTIFIANSDRLSKKTEYPVYTVFAANRTSLRPSIKRKIDGNDGLRRNKLIRKMHMILSYTTNAFSMTKRNCCHHAFLMKLLARHSGFTLQKPHIWHIINSPPVTEIQY